MTIEIEKNNASTVFIKTEETSWATFWYNDKGDLFLNSDWGNYFYSWRSFGDDFEKFLKGLELGYLYGKMASSFTQYPVEGRRSDVLKKLLGLFLISLNKQQEETLKKEINCAFESWADDFFSKTEPNAKNDFKHLDKYVIRDEAFDDFLKVTGLVKWSSIKFRKSLISYCELKGYTFNPRHLHTFQNRIILRIKGKSQEVFFIKTKEESLK